MSRSTFRKCVADTACSRALFRMAKPSGSRSLEFETDIRKDREQNPIGGDIAKTLEWHQSIDAAGDYYVLRKRRPIGETDPGIGADAGVNVRLEQKQLQRIGARET